MPDFPVHRALERGDQPSLSPHKKTPLGRTLYRFGKQPAQSLLLLFPVELASLPPPFFFFFSSFPFKSKPGKASDVGTAAASSSWLLGEGGGGDIPDHKTRILL